ncbi:MAG: aromatic amino acid transport family protein [Candidatus Woesearchaeota archaeon]
MKKEVWEAVATLVGATIGAGVLGIPYVIAKAGFIVGLIDILVIGFFILMLQLFMGEIVLRTKGNHQITGFAEKYIGKKGKFIVASLFILSIYGALIAYLIASGELLSTIFGGNPIYYGFGFFIFCSTIIYIGIKAIKRWEMGISMILIGILVLITVISFTKINYSNLQSVNFNNILVPYGVILFSLFGTVAIPEMKEELKKNKKELKKAIIIGTTISILIAIIFSFVVLGVVGLQNFESLEPDQRIATIALGQIMGRNMLIFANLFALFALTTSFLALGYGLKEMFHFDDHIGWRLSWIFTISVPIIFFFIDSFIVDITNFINILGFTGTFALGLIGIMTVIIYIRAKKLGERKPEYVITKNKVIEYLLIGLFVLGMAYEIVKMVL